MAITASPMRIKLFEVAQMMQDPIVSHKSSSVRIRMAAGIPCLEK